MSSLILKNATVISPADNINKKTDIIIKDGIIAGIDDNIASDNGSSVKDCAGMIISPGFVEMHSHMREPGQESKETLETGLSAAIAGGYTAVCAMPNTSPVVDNKIVFEYVQRKAKEVSSVEFHQFCAVTQSLKSEKLTDFRALQQCGAIAFSDDGRPIENLELLKYALNYAKSLDTLIVLHSEDSVLAKNGVINEGTVSDKLGLKGIPDAAESAAIARELEIIRSVPGVRVHFAHVSTKRSVELIRQAKKEGVNVTCETAPHYFSFCDSDIKGYDARYKMNPPLRSEEDKKAIIGGIIDGTIDAIATDHAPHTNSEKQLPIQYAPMGIVGLETALGAVITNLVKKNYIPMERAIALLSTVPAKILRLENQGSIKTGNISNLSVFNPNRNYVVDGNNFRSKCKLTPFEGKELFGKVEFVVINGEIYQ